LAGNADLTPFGFGGANNARDHVFDRQVALVEVMGDDLRVLVDSEHKLRKAVGADGEAIADLGELSFTRNTLLSGSRT
jgi:hypothetical protein